MYSKMLPQGIAAALLSSAPSGISIRRVVPLQRQIPLARTMHVRGHYPAGPGKPLVPFESLLEKRFIKNMLRFPEAQRIVSQPLTIQYSIGDQDYRYTPDYLVSLERVPTTLKQLGFGLKTLVECKPCRKIPHEAERLARHLRATLLARDEPIIVVTDSDLHLAVFGGAP